MKKVLPVLFLFSLFFASCDLFDMDLELEGNFWAINIKNNMPYRIDAEKLYVGAHCTVWAEKGRGVTVELAQEVADKYDIIYGQLIDTFSPDDINLLERADRYGDNDGKLCILLLDIRDNYEEGKNDSYVSGYFHHNDLYSITGSNKRDMIYIDTHPGIFYNGKVSTVTACRTLAHESQHLMNYTASLALRNGGAMDTWIDEGLSSAAEWMQLGGHPSERWNYYILNGDGDEMEGLIDKGNNFYVWGNRSSESVYANLDDYATVYLFFQWLRLQAGTKNIYKDIISSDKHNYEAVIHAFNNYSSAHDQDYSDWGSLLKDWLAANSINATSGIYGYMNDPTLKHVTVHYAPAATSILLYPGEGVYSRASTQPVLTGQGTNIRNVYLANNQANSSFPGTSVLLTYNINTTVNKQYPNNSARETGRTTGAAPSVMPVLPSPARSVLGTPALRGPFPIDAVVRNE